MFNYGRPRLTTPNQSSTYSNAGTTRFPVPNHSSINGSDAAQLEDSNVQNLSIITSFFHEMGSKKKSKLRIKLQYRGEMSCIEIERPVSYTDLTAHIHSKYKRQLNVYYTLDGNSVVVPVRNQHELELVIELLDNSSSRKSLHLLLSQHQSDSGLSNYADTSNISLQPDASGTYTTSPSRITEISPSECPSSCSNYQQYGSRSIAGSSVSSGIVVTDRDFVDGKGKCTPRAPTNWKQGNLIGSGGFASVYACCDVDTGRIVALKKFVISDTKMDDRTRARIAQLENEINMLSSVQHPRIVQYLGAQRTGNSFCIFMEYMAGGSIKDVIRTYGPLSSSVARRNTFQVLEGLAYLHRDGVGHYDIKPENLLRDANGDVKIADFGYAKNLQQIRNQQSMSDPLPGTALYVAPELLQNTNYGRKADLWSLGCTLLEMLTGKSPWYPNEPIAVILSLKKGTLPCPLPLEENHVLASLLLALLQIEPNRRPTAAELLKRQQDY